jgi:hypothetical protein
VRGAQAAEVPALHGALETLALRGAGDVDELTRHEVLSRDLRPDVDQVVGADAEFLKLALRFNVGHSEVLAL